MRPVSRIEAPVASPTPLIAALLIAIALEQRAVKPGYTFDGDRIGAIPSGFALAAMRQAGPGEWLVQREGADTFLLHRADLAAAGLTMALAPDAPLRDVEATVRLRLAGGGRAGGLVWRYQDASNYHAVVLDLERGALVLFQVVDGTRISLEAEDDLELDAAAWHTLKIRHDGDEIRVSLGGIPVFAERDRRSGKRAPPGRTGVIAAGNSEVRFDNLRIEPDRDKQ
jgi:hypothetical protein